MKQFHDLTYDDKIYKIVGIYLYEYTVDIPSVYHPSCQAGADFIIKTKEGPEFYINWDRSDKCTSKAGMIYTDKGLALKALLKRLHVHKKIYEKDMNRARILLSVASESLKECEEAIPRIEQAINRYNQ